MMLAGVAAITVAAPAFALDTPGSTPLQLPLPTAVPTVPLPTAVPTVPLPVPTAVPTVRLPVPTAVPTVQLPLPTVAPPPSGGGGSGGSSSGGSTSGGSSSGGSSSGGSTSGGSSSGGSASAGSSSGGGGASDGGSSGGGSRSGAAAAASGGGAASAGGSGQRRLGGRSRAGGAPGAVTRADRIRQREQRLQETVISRQACLGDLTRPERRVLVLRAGVGPGRPLSRVRVARRLDISRKRVARLERAGLHRLRGVCRRAAPSAAAAEPVAGKPGDLVAAVDTPTRPAVAKGSGGGADRGSGGGRSGGTSDTGGPRGGVEGVSATHPPSTGGGINLVIPLILVLLAIAAWAIARAMRAGLRAPASGAAPPEEPVRGPWRPRLRSNMQGPGWTEQPPGDTGDPSRWPPAAAEPPDPPAHADENWAETPPRRVSRR